MLAVILGIMFSGVWDLKAQSSYEPGIRELKGQLGHLKRDTAKFNVLLLLSRSYLFKPEKSSRDADSALMYLNEAAVLNGELRDRRGSGRIVLLQAMIYNYQGLVDKGLQSSEAALKIFTDLRLKADIAEAQIIIGQHYNNDEPGLSRKIGYYQKAVRLFEEAGYKNRMATTLKDLADFQMIANQSTEALKNLRAAVSIYLSTGYRDMQGVYDLLGFNLARMGDYVDALKFGLLAVKTAEAVNDTSLQLGTIYYRTSFACYMTRQYASADIYVNKALKVAAKYKDTSAMVIMTLNKGYFLMKMAKFKEVIPLIAELNRLGAATRSPGAPVEMAYLSMTDYLYLKQYDKARIHFERLRSLSADPGIQGEIHEKALRGMISYYQFTGRYAESYAFIAEHQRFCKANGYRIFMPQEELWLFKADSALGNYVSAIKHYQAFKKVDDSILMEKNTRQTALLNIQYESEKKDKDILSKTKDIRYLKKQSQLQQIRLEQQKSIKNIIICGSGMLMLILIIGYNRFRLKQRNNLLLQAQQTEINEQNITLKNFNARQSSLLNEKEWLLREVHHRVKNNLQVTMSLLNIQSSYLDNEQALHAIQDSQRRIHAMSLIHQKLYQSDTPTEIDMSVYIPELVKYLKECFGIESDIRFVFDVVPVTLDVAQAIPLGLILNEAITNAIKYAFKNGQLGTIVILMKIEMPDHIRLSIADNGIGLPPDFDPDASNSLGMNLMRGLSAQIDGQMHIERYQGTRVNIVFRDFRSLQVQPDHEKNELTTA
ncbi:tetratricopeptide repeat-containing sensor histidine kinase [Mucilaginibacter celer]|nr:sensor histidine kinase [Mucilaginibacter celer]